MDRLLSFPTPPLPSLDAEEALPRPREQDLHARSTSTPSRWPLTLAALCYTLLAAVLATAVVVTGAPLALTPLAAAYVLTACAVEWRSYHEGAPWARDLAPAVYVAGAVLLPASWVVTGATLAAVVSRAAQRDSALATRAALAAHAILSATLLVVALQATLGDGRVLRDLLALAGHPSALLDGLRAAWSNAGPATSAPADVPWRHVAAMPLELVALVGLGAAYYLLETVPLALVCAMTSSATPSRIWRDLHGYVLPLQVVALPLALSMAILYDVARPLTLLALPLLGGMLWLARRLHMARLLDAEARVLRENTAGLYANNATAQERATRGETRLEAVLSAVQAIGGNDNLHEVTTTLAKAAARLTPFQSCAVYLYESRDGLFVPYAGAGALESPRRGEAVPRGRVEGLMSLRHRLGYSYYAPRPQQSGVPRDAGDGLWRDGDLLLVPLLLKNGDVTGYIALDRPAHKRIPTSDELAPLETVAFLTASVIARLRHTDEALHLAASDGLTGLLNRRALEETLRRELAAAARRNRSLALMMIDIDDFGSVNNTYGHQVGDAALRLVAGVIGEHLRESDAGGRYGGDEFAIILPELAADQASAIAERLRAALAEATRRAAADGTLPQIYTSIGVASYPHHARGADDLIKAADEALYEAKGLGKNCVSVK